MLTQKTGNDIRYDIMNSVSSEDELKLKLRVWCPVDEVVKELENKRMPVRYADADMEKMRLLHNKKIDELISLCKSTE